MEAHAELKSGFEALAFITKRTEEDLSHFTWRPSNDDEKHSFVSEKAALAYLKHKDDEKRLNKEVLLGGMEGVIDITSVEVEQQLNQWIEKAQHASQGSKRQRVDKPDFVGLSRFVKQSIFQSNRSCFVRCNRQIWDNISPLSQNYRSFRVGCWG